MDAKQPIFAVIDQLGFNPRARDGREFLTTLQNVPVDVSIHAPVMDAKSGGMILAVIKGFNPRARDGREEDVINFSKQMMFQSTRP